MKKTPSTKSSCALLAGALTAAAFVAAPSAASAQLQLTVLAFETDRIELSISGTLSGGPPTSSSQGLSIQGTSQWVTSGSPLTLSGPQPLAGLTLTAATAFADAFGRRIVLNFSGNLISGTTQSSGASFTLTAGSPVFDPSAIAIADLAFRWGYNDEPVQPYGVFQSNAVAVPEPSAYAALIGLAALGCVALRRRAL